MNDEHLEVYSTIVDKFKYLGTTLMKDEQSETEIHIRMVTATTALVRLITIWKSRNISLHTKILLYKITNTVYTIL